MLFGVENAVGKTFRTTIYGSTEDYTVVGVYRKEISPLQKLMQGGAMTKEPPFSPIPSLPGPTITFTTYMFMRRTM